MFRPSGFLVGTSSAKWFQETFYFPISFSPQSPFYPKMQVWLWYSPSFFFFNKKKEFKLWTMVLSSSSSFLTYLYPKPTVFPHCDQSQSHRKLLILIVSQYLLRLFSLMNLSSWAQFKFSIAVKVFLVFPDAFTQFPFWVSLISTHAKLRSTYLLHRTLELGYPCMHPSIYNFLTF
jgi:hypothetical protein